MGAQGHFETQTTSLEAEQLRSHQPSKVLTRAPE